MAENNVAKNNMAEKPLRILIVAGHRYSTPSPWKAAWKRPQMVITEVLKILKHEDLISPDHVYDNSRCRFMGARRSRSKVYIVFDLFNTNYNFYEAHLPMRKNDLPVKSFTMRPYNGRCKVMQKRYVAYLQVNWQVRIAHESCGWSLQPPYMIDHLRGTIKNPATPPLVSQAAITG
ncbi:hypothetical protein AAL_06506 [Moelleriella libera RCEF 2490]|uniref:Uncharacterized protein n=1 Tax=Moelleriella libera RCEF 2490 TaxID=1081109 RepID=A0A167YTT0_9HYPO|nr:hypothetical protein AAL_06506 [Moelleriella libera RCEF 2490]